MGQSKIFNRDRETAAIVEFLVYSTNKLLLVTGESGCGKSAIVNRALEEVTNGGLATIESVLSYRFAEKIYANEGELFPQFLMDSYASLRPSWSLDLWMRRHSTYADSWALRLPAVTFNFKMSNFKEPEKAGPFFRRFCKDIGKRYSVFRIENGENYQAEHNLRVIHQLIIQKDGPKLIIEVGTLTHDDETIIRFLQQSCQHEQLKVGLFDTAESARCFYFIHQKEPPKRLLDVSRGNALAIRHYGTALADLPAGERVRKRLDGFSSDSMILLWCLTALRGSADIDFLNDVSGLGDGFDTALIELRLADVVQYEDGIHVEFSHSLFGPYFMSEQFASDVNRYGRKRVIHFLEGLGVKNVADLRELSLQYHAMSDHELAWRSAGQAAMMSYRQQDFRTVVDLAAILDAWVNAPDSSRNRADILLLQTAIRTGDQSLAIERLHRLRDNLSGTVILLKAQACYLMNNFGEGAKLCGGIANNAADPFLAARALGIRASCHIAAGLLEEAADDFAVAKALASDAHDIELEIEILRLSPEVEPDPVWRLRYEDMIRSSYADHYPYLHAKCLHNFGAFLALSSGGIEGLDHITSSMAVFKSGNYPEYSYSVVLLSAIMLLSGQLSEARDLLESSEIWCHEQYDTFGLKTNLGICSALEEDWSTAFRYFSEAQIILDQSKFPLSDPYFHFVSRHNVAMAKAGLGEFREAIAILDTAIVPLNTYDHELKVARRERFLYLLAKYKLPDVKDLPLDSQRWATRAYVLEPATLQFFDFNINVLPNAFSLS